MRRLESKAAAARRARVEFDSYSDSVWLTENETAAVMGFSEHTLKGWRLSGSPKGPQPSYVHNMVRYEAGEIRRWRAENSSQEGGSTKPMLQITELQKPKKGRASTPAQRLDNLAVAAAKGSPNGTKASGLAKRIASLERQRAATEIP